MDGFVFCSSLATEWTSAESARYPLQSRGEGASHDWSSIGSAFQTHPRRRYRRRGSCYLLWERECAASFRSAALLLSKPRGRVELFSASHPRLGWELLWHHLQRRVKREGHRLPNHRDWKFHGVAFVHGKRRRYAVFVAAPGQ